MGFRSEWGAQFPTQNSTALDAPPGYITMYTAFFREGNFRLPMTKFTGEVLTNYGLHISWINALGLPPITHFEFIRRANRIEPTFEMFNVFYFVSYTGGFYSFNSRTGGVSPCSANPPKSLHDWKQKFFYIYRGVIPIDLCIIAKRVKGALVGAGMSMLWAPQNPKGIPVYGYQGKGISIANLLGYSLLNVLDPKAAGAMVEAILPEGKPVWDGLDDTTDPTREEVIVLSSGGSDGSQEGLPFRPTSAGPPQGTVPEPVNEIAADDDVETAVDTAEQLETRKKKKREDKSEEKKVEETTVKAPRKRPSTSSFLSYVIVTGDKSTERDPDDDASLTEIVKRKKALEDKKKELDEQAAAALAAKKLKLQKETPPAPSESKIDLGVFSAKHGNLLEKILQLLVPEVQRFPFVCAKSGKGVHKVDISKITPLTSPPSRTFGLSPPHLDPGARRRRMKWSG
ncbi:hypothetical protein Hanom_Chr04g00377541 [Helianthus anomalus]